MLSKLILHVSLNFCLSVDESSLATIEISDSSSLLGDYEVVTESVMGNEVQLPIDLEGTAQEEASLRRPEKAHLELEYVRLK